MKTSDFLSFAL